MGGGVYARALHRAADILGGKEKLRQRLRVPMRELDLWLAGKKKPPMEAFLKAVDVISSAPTERSPLLQPPRGKSENERMLAMRRAILERGPQPAQTASPISPSAFLKAKYEPGDGGAMIDAALDAAISATAADKGNVQMRLPEGLRIVASRGLPKPFLDFFAVVDERSSSTCGLALKTGRRIVVSDVASDILFAGTPAGDVLAEAGIRAVQSTPLRGASGNVLGVLSTHWGAPHDVTEREADLLDQIARRTAFWLEGGQRSP